MTAKLTGCVHAFGDVCPVCGMGAIVPMSNEEWAQQIERNRSANIGRLEYEWKRRKWHRLITMKNSLASTIGGAEFLSLEVPQVVYEWGSVVNTEERKAWTAMKDAEQEMKRLESQQ